MMDTLGIYAVGAFLALAVVLGIIVRGSDLTARGKGSDMSYRVSGTAHGTEYDERGFATMDEATDYASQIIDGDYDATVEVTSE